VNTYKGWTIRSFMNGSILTEDGALEETFLPAMYLDSSFLIDYWMIEGKEVEIENDEWDLVKRNELPHLQVVRNILRSEKRIDKMIEIRKKIIYEEVKTTPIYSPISLLELMEWEAEAAFKQIASEAAGALSIQRKSKKEIGCLLKKALNGRRTEVKRQERKGRESEESTGLEILMIETYLNRGFVECHGLVGLQKVDIVNFDLGIDRVWKEPSAYAYLQLGVADIVHILLAQHLGCEYIATFDSDFKRIKDIIMEKTGISVLLSPEEIIRVL
jgi:hypothetical protein